jgi:hypothetical protein
LRNTNGIRASVKQSVAASGISLGVAIIGGGECFFCTLTEFLGRGRAKFSFSA